ncbi:hypothetical protein GCM10022243_17620 [Saccharothrix violaceirubra]|uniref:Anti-sigma regulatory factor (Ser/Thr protein kinase) n=1 Tax=Saccharothrix violaceirubra TaxID=413306 RepID=A0A7W7T0P1_9PSEU|nr:ATP-binding protein [Saccharothrix violaceirubra]MBB4964447.1 anti-sigma regulatory factor (Ser/Thr protein kinase) [Saccharothrix violaceirubra]
MTERLADHRWAADFPADAGLLGAVRAGLDAWLLAVGLSEDDRYDLVIAANEAMSNAAEHAYGPARAGVVRVRAELCPDGSLHVVVSDDGVWRVPPIGLTDRGRGLLLMRENADEVHVERAPTGTTVELVFAAGHTTRGTAAGTVPAEPVEVSERDGLVEVVVRGDVPARAGPALRRRILTAARGGSVPVMVDVRGLGTHGEGLIRGLVAVAEAASAAGNRVVVRLGTDDVVADAVRAALVASGVDQVVDLVAHVDRWND